MITAFIIVCALLAVASLVIYSMATKRIAGSMRPEDFKAIEDKSATARDLVNKEADQQVKEVKNATAEQLLTRSRLRVLRGGNTSTTTGK